MSVFGPAIAQSVAGLSQAEHVVARDKDRKKATQPDGKKRDSDAVEINVETALAADAVRNMKGNADEETAEDRAEHDHYQTASQKKAERPRLDVQG
jgi:hypothetical protein